LETDGLPFAVRHHSPNAETRQAAEDVRLRRNLSKPYTDIDKMFDDILAD
jgi:antitoxin component of RelBE/YafQ-DinJ toxin-antitoxin module